MKRVFQSALGLVLAVSMVFGSFTATAYAETSDNLEARSLKVSAEDMSSDVSRQLVKTVTSPSLGTFAGEWTVLSLARAGYNVPKNYYKTYYNNMVNEVKSKKGKLSSRKYTEYSRVILGLTSIGRDPHNVGGYDLVSPLADYDSVIYQGINGPIFALIALDSGDYDMPEAAPDKTQNSREDMVDYILSKEIKKDTSDAGGWALTGTTPDPDITAMALQALAKYESRSDVSAAISRAVTVLSSIQKDNGGYASWGTTNSESAAQVLVALTALGIDPQTDQRFIKQNGSWLLSYLEQYYVKGQGFKHITSGSVDAMATDQCAYALAAYNRFVNGENFLYDMTDVSPVSPDPDDSGNSGGKNSGGTADNTAPGTTAPVASAAGEEVVIKTQPDANPVVSAGRSAVSATVSADAVSSISAATAEKPIEVKITVPTSTILEQLKNNAINAVDCTIRMPGAVANNANPNATVRIYVDQSVLQAAKNTKKDLAVSMINTDTGKEICSWNFSGTDLKNSIVSATDVDLALSVAQVKNDTALASVAVSNSTDKNAAGAVLRFGNSGLLPAPAKVKVYVGNQESCAPNSSVFLYRFNSTTKALEQMPKSEYKVDADGYITITIAHCADYVLLPKAATSPYPVQSDTTYPTGVKQGENYTFAVTVSGSMVPSLTVGDGKAFVGTVKQVGNKYYFTVKAVGTVGSVTAVYSTLQGQKPVLLCYISTVK